MIPFNKPARTGREEPYVLEAMGSDKISGDGPFSRQCQAWFESRLGCPRTLLTPSCTHALEMAALLLDVQPGDEIIMPSYTFVSTANAFVLRGARIVFVDIRPDTMNIDEQLIEAAVSPRTRAVVVVHYAGVACEMDTIMALADKHRLAVIEDAAQGMMATYKARPLGTIGHMGAYSFHETKNYTSGGEGGLLLINDTRYITRSEIIREKGTNRSQFFRGMVDKYSWVDLGSSYLPSELQAAYLWGQLEMVDAINASRLNIWQAYWEAFRPLADAGHLTLPTIPVECGHNAHMFYLKLANPESRDALLAYLKAAGVMAVFHYVPLHSAEAGCQFSTFWGEDRHTTAESERLIRLPLWYGLESRDIAHITRSVLSFFDAQ